MLIFPNLAAAISAVKLLGRLGDAEVLGPVLLGTSKSDLAFTGNTLSNNHPAIATGGGGVTISGGDNSGSGVTLTYNIANNAATYPVIFTIN